jgi:hypothetical protein
MDSDAVGINCTQRWGAADTLVTTKGKGEGTGSDGRPRLQSKVAARRVQKQGQAWSVAIGGGVGRRQ